MNGVSSQGQRRAQADPPPRVRREPAVCSRDARRGGGRPLWRGRPPTLPTDPACRRAELAADLSPNSTTSKLCLLLLHFPKLRLLWSRRPLHTIAIFDALKRGAPEPDVDKAAAVGTHAEQAAGQLFNMTPQDLLRSMPGVHAHNYRRLMNAVTNMHELSQLSLGRLAELLGEQNARRLHTFLHQSA